MADQKISALTDGGAGSSSDQFVLARAGSSFKVVGSNLPTGLAGWINVKDGTYGAKGDGVTSDTTAINSAMSAQNVTPRPVVHVPVGNYLTTIAPTLLTGPFRGEGQIIDSGANKRGKWFSAITAAPSSAGTWSSVSTAFNGDLSRCQIAMEHRVTGSTTLSQPTVGYVDNHESAPVNIYLYNESGWNQGTATNAGRTGIAAMYLNVYNSSLGLGDAACITANGFVSGAKASATSFLANPAAVLYNGGAYAGANGVYLNPMEINCVDQGFDVAANGLVLNLTRTVATGALDVLWGGLRVQALAASTQPADYALMAYNNTGGGFRVGLDLSAAGLTTTGTWVSAAITLKADQRIYLNATGTDAGASIYRRPSSTGVDYIKYDTGISGINFVTGNTSVLQLASTQVTAAVNVAIADGFALIAGSTNGLKIGTATTQKIGFYNVTPVVQQNTTGNVHTVTAGSTTSVFTNTTFDGSTGSTSYTVGDIVKALKAYGLLAA